MEKINDQKSDTVLMLGKWQDLPVVRMSAVGAYLGGSQEQVLLPKKQVPSGAQPGDIVKVFIYKDSSDRLIATVNRPKITVGEIAALKVKQITGIGAFLDWGLEKDLLLPFGQQTQEVEEGCFYPVALYVDRSGRLAASMWIDKYVTGSMDEKKKAVSLYRLQADAENIYEKIGKKGGSLPYDDKASPEVIERDFGLSKNSFKRGVGILYKARRLVINENSIELIS